jgi:hypothetical protein
MQNTNPRHIPASILLAGALIALIPIAGILIWLAWLWPAGMFWLLFGGLASALVIAALYGIVGALALYNRKARLRTIEAEHHERITHAMRSQGLPASVTNLNYKALPALPPAVVDAVPASAPPSVPSFS